MFFIKSKKKKNKRKKLLFTNWERKVYNLVGTLVFHLFRTCWPMQNDWLGFSAVTLLWYFFVFCVLFDARSAVNWKRWVFNFAVPWLRRKPRTIMKPQVGREGRAQGGRCNENKGSTKTIRMIMRQLWMKSRTVAIMNDQLRLIRWENQKDFPTISFRVPVVLSLLSFSLYQLIRSHYERIVRKKMVYFVFSKINFLVLFFQIKTGT